MYPVRRLWGVLLVLVMLAAVLLPAASVRGAPGAFRKDLVLGNIQEPSGLNALTSVASTEVQFMPLFTAYSFLRNERFEQINEYVTQVPTLANGLWKLQPDGRMEVTWKLRPGMTWHDGAPFTAEDFRFTWDVYRDQRAPLGTRPALEDIESVRFPDALTIVVRYRRPSSQANLLWLGAFAAPLPRHIVGPMLQRVGIERYPEIAYGSDPVQTVGVGPYVFRSWQRGVEMVFEANPRYHLGRPVLDRIVVRFFTDVNALVTNVLAGRIDAIAPSPGGIPLAQALEIDDRVQRGQLTGYRVAFHDAPASEAYIINHESPLLQDRRVRQALLFAMDREGIVQAVFRGRVSVAHSYLPARHPWYLADIRKYGYDPVAARRLLDEAGWRPGPDGVRRNAAGEPLRLVVTVPSGDRARERMQEIVQAQWREVGVEMVIDNRPIRLILGDVWGTGLRPPDILNLSHPIDDFNDVDVIYHSENVPPVGRRGRNYMRWKNPQYDALLNDYAKTFDAGRRKELHARLQRMWAEDVPILLIYTFVGASVVKSDLAGFRPLGLACVPGCFTWNARTWRWTR
jgi:peptide/nickel transport system substrate-binding protein